MVVAGGGISLFVFVWLCFPGRFGDRADQGGVGWEPCLSTALQCDLGGSCSLTECFCFVLPYIPAPLHFKVKQCASYWVCLIAVLTSYAAP